jgi:hypothetical protein
VLSDGAAHADLVARLRCHQSGIHGSVGASQELRVFDSRKGFRIPFAWRGFLPAGCSLELLHPLYRMAYTPLERRFAVNVGDLPLSSWEELLAEKPEGLSEADLHRHIFYLRHYYFPAFDSEALGELARYVPALPSLPEFLFLRSRQPASSRLCHLHHLLVHEENRRCCIDRLNPPALSAVERSLVLLSHDLSSIDVPLAPGPKRREARRRSAGEASRRARGPAPW